MKASRAFTLVEMMVVLTIIVLITMIAVLGQNNFNKSLILTDTAYTLAFSIREAQSLGLSSQKFGAIQNAGYGVYFANGTPTSYRLFADVIPATPTIQSATTCPGHTYSTGPEARPGNCLFTDSVNETVRTYSLNRGFAIKSFCGTQRNEGTLLCSTSTLTALNIVYVRGTSNPVITGVRGLRNVSVPMTSATIRVASPDGTAERCVHVSAAGQVAVLNVGEPNCL